MKINIVTEPKSMRWILRVWAEQLAKRIPNCTISDMVPDKDADVNVFCNYALFQPGGKTVSIFTHKEEDLRGLQFDDVASKSDWCFAQSKYTLGLLPKNKSSILSTGLGEEYKHRDIRIGVIGRYYPSGRKRHEWAKKIEKIDGIEVVWSDGKYSENEMPELYDSVDYVLVTSKYEGGPMCIKEALSRGKMVITTRVGWSDDYTAIRYDTYNELEKIIKGLVIKDGWDEGAKQIIERAKLL